MLTFFALIIASAVVVAGAGMLARSPRGIRVGGALGRVLAWPVVMASRAVAALAHLLLGAGAADDHVAWWRQALAAIVWLVPMAVVLGLAAWRPGPLGVVDPGYLLILGALLPVLVITAALLVARDDFDAMDGVSEGRRIRSGRTVGRTQTLVIATVIFVTYVAAIAWWLSGKDAALFAARPATGWAVVDYGLVALRALPTGYFAALLDRLTGDNTAVAFGPSLLAQSFAFITRALGAALALTLATIAIQHAWQVRRVVDEIAERDERDERRSDLLVRAAAAPPSVRRRILLAAVTPSAMERQKRIIIAAKDIGLTGLPAAFCREVETFDTEVQSFGLDQCLEMFRHNARDFGLADSGAALNEAARVLARGRLAVEPTKKLLRLMTSIVVIKRGGVELDDKRRAEIEATIKVELDKPRAKEDAALRGFLRDLQSALNGAQTGSRLMQTPEKRSDAARRPRPAAEAPAETVVASATPAPAIANLPVVLPAVAVSEEAEEEGSAAPPGSPPPTVH